MKIAFIGQKGIPVTFGGVEYNIDRLSKELVGFDHDVTVYVRSWYTPKTMKNYGGVRLVYIPTIKSKHLDASVHSFLCSIHALFGRYDIIHYHGIGPSFFSFIPKLFNKKIVATIHRLDWSSEKWGKLAKIFLKFGEYISVKIPDRTIVVSADLKKYVKEKYNRECIHIPHGIDEPARMAPKIIKEKYGLDGKDYILFIGRLVPEKRIDWLIEAFQSVAQKSIRAKSMKLVIAGGSSATADYVKQLQEMSAADENIIYTGYVTGNEKAELMSNAFLFSLPSHVEGFPIALLEAKSYGLCSLVSDIPPHREAISPEIDGILFKADELSELSQNLFKLIENPAKAETMGRNAKKNMEALPSWEYVARKTEKVFKELL
jgi:glycosyltransferase involved in cell wall biosynthesis